MEWIGKSYNPKATPKGGYFFSLWGFSLLMGIVIMVIITPALSLLMEAKQAMYVSLLLQGFLLFAFPAWLVETYYRRSHLEMVWRLSPQDYVMKNTIPMLLLSACTILGASVLTWKMESLPVPALFQEMERLTTEQYEMILADRQPLNRVLVWMSTVVAAPFGEEVFFRGAMMGWLLTKIKNKHAVIWIVALIFSVVHMQWTGFPARLLIGGVLGYVALYGGLWMAIFFHLLNNLAALALPQLDNLGSNWWIIVIAIPAMVLLTKYMKAVAIQNMDDDE
ncbi:MAG: type II CAAX endopeptidase family protein [Bacteroidales bacterium]|uniref:CPBP family intramembrane glutamic endopeptidase n=1 Tax=Porphyromonas sp. TaxID=1924944 RepID=UPI002978880A|nr:type II CAAX endopeptidase family protein [Porphyromonas sp.]MDD7437289.1 type II CAAX endopeptidase family protein [Bacteroidales bacterium]MDY3066566.1 type II CAAX endopeptidase family protein [Porphyromonas sp.]